MEHKNAKKSTACSFEKPILRLRLQHVWVRHLFKRIALQSASNPHLWDLSNYEQSDLNVFLTYPIMHGCTNQSIIEQSDEMGGGIYVWNQVPCKGVRYRQGTPYGGRQKGSNGLGSPPEISPWKSCTAGTIYYSKPESKYLNFNLKTIFSY